MFKKVNDKVFYENKEGKKFFNPQTSKKFFISIVKHYNTECKKFKILSTPAITKIETVYEKIKKE